jgi:hypothetical protein
MGNGIVRLERDGQEWFLEWSTIVDAPVTYGMDKAELRAYVKEKYGTDGLEHLDPRINRARAHGHSFMDDPSETAADYIVPNRAGPGETELSLDELIDAYCVRKCAYDPKKGIL